MIDAPGRNSDCDGSKLLRLDDDPKHLHLKASERLRIYTFRKDGAPPSTSGRLKQTLAWCHLHKKTGDDDQKNTDVCGENNRLTKGIFKTDKGEATRSSS